VPSNFRNQCGGFERGDALRASIPPPTAAGARGNSKSLDLLSSPLAPPDQFNRPIRKSVLTKGTEVKRPTLKFSDRSFTCTTISINAASFNLEDGTYDCEVTPDGVFLELPDALLFLPQAQVYKVRGQRPRAVGRPKAPPPHRSDVEVFELRQTSGPRRRDRKPKYLPGGKPTAPLNR